MTLAIIVVVFPLCLAVAACSDFLTMLIPNRVSAILLGAFIVVAPLAGLGLTEVAMHLAAGLLVFSICFALFALNVMGGGDAKLLTASAVWFGMSFSLIEYLVYVSFFGGLLTFAILSLRANTNLILASGLAYPSSPLMLAAFG
jgi:prepilin peptidase CpaA